MMLIGVAGWKGFRLREWDGEGFTGHGFLFLAGMASRSQTMVLGGELEDPFTSDLAGNSLNVETLVDTRIEPFASTVLQLPLYYK